MDWFAWPARSWCLLFVFVVAASLAGCAHRTPETRPPLAKPVTPDAPYLIKVGDTLDIRFYKTPELNVEVPVRSDGMVSLELLGDVPAAGHAPRDLATELTRRYADELTDPRVTVIVRGFGGQVFVQGDGIARPAAIPYADGLTALQAIAGAGGMNTLGRRSNVVLLRREAGEWKGYTLDLRKPLQGDDFAQDVMLQPSDIIYVPRKRISNVNLFVQQYIRDNFPIQPIIPTF
jgi:protein involved in polysaccharide export with SLBB domain